MLETFSPLAEAHEVSGGLLNEAEPKDVGTCRRLGRGGRWLCHNSSESDTDEEERELV